MGGTWYWRYPGIACEVESYVYMPLLEELDYVPTESTPRAKRSLLTVGASPNTTICIATHASRPRSVDPLGYGAFALDHIDQPR